MTTKENADAAPERRRLKLPTLRAAVTPIATAVLFFGAIYAIHLLVSRLSYHQVLAEFRALPGEAILLSVLATAGSYVALIGYDWSGLRYAGVRLPWRTLALGSFCAYALGNSAGWGMLTGGSVRFRVFAAAGLSPGDIVRAALFGGLSFGIGITVVAAVAMVIRPDAVVETGDIAPATLRAIGIVILIAAAALTALTFVRRAPVRLGRWTIPVPSGRIVLTQLVISAADVALASAALYALLPPSGTPYPAFLVIYSIASVAGVASHVPGGLGVFEAVILYAMEDRLPVEALAAALLTFRVIYYVLPLFLAILLLAVSELLRSARGSVALAVARRLGDLASGLVPHFMAIMTFLAGVMLLISGATPAGRERLEILEQWVPLTVVEVSDFVGSLAALALLILARGLYRRLNAAYWMTVALLAGSIVLSLARGVAFPEALALAAMLALLLPCRREFYRHSSLLDEPLTGSWVVALICTIGGTLWVTFFAFKHVEYANEMWWQFAFDSEAPRALRAVLGVVVAAALFGLVQLLRPPAGRIPLPDAAQLEHARRIIRAQDHADANLALMNDKMLLFSENGDAFVMFAIRGQSWVAMGDPVGPREEWTDLIWSFREAADRHNGRAVFYQIRPQGLPLYLDTGMTMLKLGEEAHIPLAGFSLQGGARKDLRYTLTRGTRDGLEMTVLPPGGAAALTAELTAISDAWLEERNSREKRFSLGAFSPAYVDQFDTAVVRENGRPVAFATIFTTDTRAEAMIDLMRHRPDASRFTMEFLFIKLILHYQEAGYRMLNLGLAPLSGLEAHPLAPLWHRIGGLLYSHGEHFYNFQGLRRFKEKFDPVWEPRYLATPAGVNALVVMTDVAALTGGGLKGLVTK